MKLKKAIKVLKKHNKWRTDHSDNSRYKSTCPTTLTEAIDTILAFFDGYNPPKKKLKPVNK